MKTGIETTSVSVRIQSSQRSVLTKSSKFSSDRLSVPEGYGGWCVYFMVTHSHHLETDTRREFLVG